MKNIKLYSEEELEQEVLELGWKAFRGRQIYEWLWKKGVSSFSEMTSLSLEVRTTLEKHFFLPSFASVEEFHSEDKTIKCSIKLPDHKHIESVLIPTANRITGCVSSQVGCSLDCSFCATAKLKMRRNLDAWEIFEQVNVLQKIALRYFKRPLTNIVFMGMGEPLLNYKPVLSSIEKITSQKGLGFSNKRITVSTAGLPKFIQKLADDNVKFNLAVSLHSAIEKKRSNLMKISLKNSISDIEKSVKYWYEKTKRKATFEYIVFKNVNDKEEDIEALIKLCKRVPVKVNIIEYNGIDGVSFMPASKNVIQQYLERLEKNNITTRVRFSRGKDIMAACGQLANVKNTTHQKE